MSENQVVAYNMSRARQLRGWTQDQTAKALEPYLGKRWSKASMSQAERSVAGKVTRTFDADELVAFSQTFELPVAWFLMPPTPQELTQIEVASSKVAPAAEFIDLVLGDDATAVVLAERVTQMLADLPQQQLTASQRRIGQLTRAKSDALADADYRVLQQLETQLREASDRAARLTETLRRTKAQREQNNNTPSPPRARRAT